MVIARTAGVSTFVFACSRNNEPEAEGLERIKVILKPAPRHLELTNFTLQELEDFEQAFRVAIDAARPICKALDDIAVTAPETSVSFRRRYRPDPVFALFDENGKETLRRG